MKAELGSVGARMLEVFLSLPKVRELLVGLAAFVTIPCIAIAEDRLVVFDEIAEIAQIQFFDPDMNGIDWDRHVSSYRSRIFPDMSHEAFAEEVNRMLAELGASHTELYVRNSPLWYQLAGVFLPGNDSLERELAPYLMDGGPIYSGIGIVVESRLEGDFVVAVLDGHPAQTAGVLMGDRIVSVDGQPYHPISSFQMRAGQSSQVLVERRPGEIMSIAVTPALLDGRTMFEEAMLASIRIVEDADARIGYIHVWSYAGQKYQDILTSAALYGDLSIADVLILDVRGGWGGANSSFLNFFSALTVQTKSISRDGVQRQFVGSWTKPVVLLVDEGVRSGKEVFAYGFRKLGLGPIVGETTGGAVLAGRINVLSDGNLLYIAVADVQVDGIRLEGIGVEPDIRVPFDPAFAAGNDPQLERALKIARELIG